MVLWAEKSPHPPDYIPRVDEQLGLDLMESERRVMLYEKEVEMIREQLGLKQSELLEEQNIFRDEKRTLMGKIAEFTSVLAQRDKELESAVKQAENEKVDLAKGERLEDTIRSLETQLQEKADSLKNEKKASKELRRRFDDAEDALEFEQMNFEKERRSLQELVTNERMQVKALQDKFEENNKAFEVTQEELLNKIQSEEEKLSDAKAKWRVTQEQLREVEQKLDISLEEKAQLLKETKMVIGTKNLVSEEVAKLQNQIKIQEAEMEEIRRGLERDNQDSKTTAELKIEAEERLIKELQEELSKEQNKYETKKSTLEREITSVTDNLADVETQLANERAQFSKEKEMLEKKLANEIRVGRLKKKQMKKRYDEIRREMTDLWESSKRQARQEERRLRKKYERKIDTVKAQIAELETDLTTEKKRLLVEQKEMQSRHTEELRTRDATILELEANVANLGKLIADKDKIIKEKEERIQLYETSFRQFAKLGLVVTGNKIKKVAGPLKRLVQNSPPSDDVMD
eukprot:CAMPEP_0197178160 /NCGR_PEP_ID=MMETSP1423-20130617/3530_1 /TAXON_ID=476441 /ORGANISM="Pseudo-nitzschia heimii, Strain UNC1101" /LENGTH=517 /DNA_ID=CAMNT_0042627849 /DNA_START=220 /DNA_END=1773 /DNA_ORIENTATION=+